uniref:Uncharacterized protein n=1 Tax=Plectus sambesii TaxID=2011161 RepID=A0A914X2E4_9BILA
MVNLCSLIRFVVIACVVSDLKYGSILAQKYNFTIPYNYKVANTTEILATAKALQSTIYTLLQNVTNTSSSLDGYGITNTSLLKLNETLDEIVALGLQVTALNSTYLGVLSEINSANSQINTAIDLLQCFQRETACHPTPGPCYNAPCKNGGTCYPIGNTSYTCDCAQSFSGPKCETVACGTTVIPVDGTGGRLKSLNFPDLTSGYNCTWSLQASSEYFIELTINSITTTDDPPGQIYFQVVDVLSSNLQIYK